MLRRKHQLSNHNFGSRIYSYLISKNAKNWYQLSRIRDFDYDGQTPRVTQKRAGKGVRLLLRGGWAGFWRVCLGGSTRGLTRARVGLFSRGQEREFF